jgi:hypothetical protein
MTDPELHRRFAESLKLWPDAFTPIAEAVNDLALAIVLVRHPLALAAFLRDLTRGDCPVAPSVDPARLAPFAIREARRN